MKPSPKQKQEFSRSSAPLDERIDLAEAAERLLSSPVFNRAFQAVYDECSRELLLAPPGDLTVPNLHARLHALNDVKAKLSAYVTEPKLAIKNGVK